MEENLILCLCRVCLQWTKEYVNLNSSLNKTMHATSASNDAADEPFAGIKTYRDCYRICTRIEVDFKLQETLCKDCAAELEIVYNFLERAHNSERKLQNMICENNLDKVKVEDDTCAFEFQEAQKSINEHIIYIPVRNTDLCTEFSGDEKKDVIKVFSSEKKARTRKQTTKRLVSMQKLNTNRSCNAENDILNRRSDACEICGKKFATQYYMRLHMETHQEERPTYACDQCDKKYYYEGSLVVHKRVHSGNMFACDECDKKYVSKNELRVHKRFHSRDYPYVCEVCGQKYAVMSHLNTHMLRHQGMKVQCEECGKLFTSTKALYEHGFLHTGNMPFPCNYCDRGYPSRQKYKIHLKKLHDLELTEEELRKCAEKTSAQAIPKRKVKWIQVA